MDYKYMNEKTYCNYLDEITDDELYEGLLGYGMFAEKLPPIFTSIPFYEFTKKLSQPFSQRWKDYVYFESMRQNNIPRPLGIPDPLAYANLCKELKENWDELKKYFHSRTDNNTYRVSRIHIRKQKNSKCLFEMNYKNWKIDGSPEIDLLIGARYLVKSDISTCFPSIYTHSIPWAIVTKQVAKSNKEDNLWYNKIDKLCSNLRNGETHGLLIGPHASNLISEIILTAVDWRMDSLGWHYIRNIDDYTCYVDSYEKAEKFLADLNESLREYDLPINHKKTSISELPQASVNEWVRLLNRALPMKNDDFINFKIARSYLDTSISLMERNNKDAAILKYAIKVLGKKCLSINAKNYCLKTIEHYAIIYPYLIGMMDEFVFIPFAASNKNIEIFSNLVFEDGKKINNFEQMYYAIYFAIKYNFIITNLEVDYVLKSSSCLLKIFSWIYFKQKQNEEEVEKFIEYAKKIKETDFNNNWLLCYEILSVKDLKEEWVFLKKNKISFIKWDLLRI